MKKSDQIKKIYLYDVCIAFLVISNIAFGDISIIYIIAQLITIMYSGMVIAKKRGVINRNLFYYSIWLILFSLLGIISSVWASSNNTSVYSSVFSIIQVGLIGVCIILYADNLKKCIYILKVFVITAYIICVRFFISVPISFWGKQERFDNSTLFGQNTVAMALSFAALFLLILNEEMLKQIKSWWIYASVSLFMFVATMTGTKKSILIFAIGIVILLFSKAKNPAKVIKTFLLTIALLAVGYYTLMNVDFLYNAIGYRIESMMKLFNGGGTDKSTLMRYNFADYALTVFKKNPITGVGLDGFRYVNIFEKTYSHNNYTEILADLGVVGFAVFYSIYFIMLKEAMKQRKKQILPLLVMLLSLMLHFAIVSYSLELEYILVAIVVSFLGIRNTYDNKKEGLI